MGKRIKKTDNYFERVKQHANRTNYRYYFFDYLYFKGEKDVDKMPVITAKKTEEQGKIWYDLILTFPKLDSSKFDYYDDVEYCIKRWQKVGKFVSYMQQHPYDPSLEYEDDEQ